MEVLVGTDFFTVEVLTLKGLVTYYVLFFIHLESRRVSLAGMTRYPGQEWMEQQARNATMEEWGFLKAAASCCMTGIGSSVRHFVN
jgi:putative transposase